MIIVIGLAIASIISIILTIPHNFVALMILSVVLSILGICLILFSTVTVVCDKDYLRVRISFIIYKRFSLKDIISCEIVKISWYYGWGLGQYLMGYYIGF